MSFVEDIKEFYPRDLYFGNKHTQLLNSIQSKTFPYTLQDGILFYKDRVCIPNHGDFRIYFFVNTTLYLRVDTLEF
jgi:hypothetical protein